MMLVLFVIMLRVSWISCLVRTCLSGAPLCKCMVMRRERVVVVWPIYELLFRRAQSPTGHLNSYTMLVALRSEVSRAILLDTTNLAVLGVW